MANHLKPLTDNNGELQLTIAQIKSRYGIQSDNHIQFALEYINEPRRNAARAYAKIYRGKLRTTAGDQSAASALLKLDCGAGKFIHDLDTGAAQVMVRKGIVNKEQVLQELIKIGFSDIGDLYDEENNLLDMSDMQMDVTPAIKKIKEKIMKRTIDDETGVESHVLAREIEMHDKKGSLQLIGQHLQMFVQKTELEVTTSVDDIIRDITQRNADNRNGLLPKDNCRMPPLEHDDQ
jgi:hypothetical protein